MKEKLPFLTLLAVTAIYVSEVTAFGTCEISLLTMRIVEKCPENGGSWARAAEKLDCGSITQSCTDSMKSMGPPFNTQNYIFQYHCVINAWRNATIEVCALNRTILGFCAEFNIYGAVIQDNYDADCTQHTPPCPTSYNSAEAYKYPSCYEMTKNHRKTMVEEFRASSSSRCIFSLHLIILMDSRKRIFILFFLFMCILVQLNSGQCRGLNCCGPGCCAGFMLDINANVCIPCGTGYIGKHCAIICPFPMYGDGFQFRCECDNSSCNPLIGCRAALTALQDDGNLTNQYELTSLFSTPPTAESKIEVKDHIAKSLNMTVYEQPSTEYNRARSESYHSHFPQTNTIKIPKTKEKDRGTLTVGAESPLLIGIFAFNAFLWSSYLPLYCIVDAVNIGISENTRKITPLLLFITMKSMTISLGQVLITTLCAQQMGQKSHKPRK